MAAPTRTTTPADTVPIMAPTLMPLLGEGVGLGGEGVGLGGVTVAGFASTVALDITAQLGTDAIANCVLMFVTVRAAAVVVAWLDPLSCSMVTLTVDVGAKSLLAAVCRTVTKSLHRWQTTGSAVRLPHVPQSANAANEVMIESFFALTCTAVSGSAMEITTV
jgi:hypothetical protein